MKPVTVIDDHWNRGVGTVSKYMNYLKYICAFRACTRVLIEVIGIF